MNIDDLPGNIRLKYIPRDLNHEADGLEKKGCNYRSMFKSWAMDLDKS